MPSVTPEGELLLSVSLASAGTVVSTAASVGAAPTHYFVLQACASELDREMGPLLDFTLECTASAFVCSTVQYFIFNNHK